jgi:hypothetical protein
MGTILIGPPPGPTTSPAVKSDECGEYSYLAAGDTDPSTGPKCDRRGQRRRVRAPAAIAIAPP